MNNIIKMAVILALFCIASAGSLSFINSKTQPIITERSIKEEDNARRDLLMGDEIDLLDLPDSTYEHVVSDNPDTKEMYRITVKNKMIMEIKAAVPQHIELDDSEPDSIMNEANSKKKLLTFSLNDNINYLLKGLKSAIKSEIQFTRFIVVKIPFSHSSDPKKSWNMKKIYQAENDSVQCLDKETSIQFNYSQEKKSFEFVTFDGKKFNELPQQVKFREGTTDKKHFLYPDITEYFVGKMGSKRLGVVTTCNAIGYGGKIKIMAAFDITGRNKGIQIMSHVETPGLGAKVQEINPLLAQKISAKYQNSLMRMTQPWFQEQFKGLSEEETFLNVENPEGKVDSITAATITSKAVADEVRSKLHEFMELKDYFFHEGGKI